MKGNTWVLSQDGPSIPKEITEKLKYKVIVHASSDKMHLWCEYYGQTRPGEVLLSYVLVDTSGRGADGLRVERRTFHPYMVCINTPLIIIPMASNELEETD